MFAVSFSGIFSGIARPMNARTRCLICLVVPPLLALFGASQHARAVSLDYKPLKLDASKRASLQRFAAESLPAVNFDWDTIAAHAVGRRSGALAVTVSTAPRLALPGLCRRETHHFYRDSGQARWRVDEALTRAQAWRISGADCTIAAPTPVASAASRTASPPSKTDTPSAATTAALTTTAAALTAQIDVDRALPDADVLFLLRESTALRARAGGVIGGSDCARVRYCDVTLSRIERAVRERIADGREPSGGARTITTLTFSPVNPGPQCLYVMEVSFVGPLNDLAPLGARCPLP
jgi:hypothetical protein